MHVRVGDASIRFPFVHIYIRQLYSRRRTGGSETAVTADVGVETAKLTFFLLGSDLAGEEIIVAESGVSLLRHAEPLRKHRPAVGRVMSLPVNVVDRVQFTVIYSL